MEPLFTVSNDGKSVKPWLATGYTVSADKLTYTIKLRSGVKFSNGQPMTAADVKFSIDQDTATGSTGWGYINAAIKQVVVVNPSTVQIDLKYAWAPILADLSLFSNGIIPNNYGGESEAAFYNAPDRHRAVRVERRGRRASTSSWSRTRTTGSRASRTWTASSSTSSPTRTPVSCSCEGNQADIDTFPDWSTFSTLKSTPGHRGHRLPVHRDRLPRPSTRRRRRSATSTCGRRSRTRSTATRWSNAVLFGNGKPANSLFMPGLPYYDATGGETYDLAAAKQALAQSSEPHGFTTTLQIASGNANESTVAQIVQSELKPLGITVNIQQLDPTAAARVVRGRHLRHGLLPVDHGHPGPGRVDLLRGEPQGGALSTFTFYDNPTVISLNKQAESATRPDQAGCPVHPAAAADRHRTPSSPTCTTRRTPTPPRTKVHGFFVTPLGNFHLEDVYKTS